MKKTVLIAFLALSNMIIAQVGINTTNPTAMFHVLGTTTPGTGPFAFRLEDGTQAAGRVLTSDANGNGYWQAASGGSAYTFTNGLTLTGSNARLGGKLLVDTTIDLDLSSLTFTRDFSKSFGGEIIYLGKDRNIMNAKLAKNYISFGVDHNPTVSGTSLTDSGGNIYTEDFIAGFYKGATGGTAMRIGTVEYLVDGTSELFTSRDFSPLATNTLNSGTATHRWLNVYSQNGVITTSDMTLKTNVKPLSYGLNEILKLETISYNWKENKMDKTTIPSNLQDRKIGFSAQQLKTILPEVVQTHSWVAADEEGNYKRVENKNLGVYYSDIIPVTVKAIQEQQVQIEDLKKSIEELKKQNELLLKLVNKK